MGEDLKTKGFLDIPIDISLDLFAEIKKLKRLKICFKISNCGCRNFSLY